MNIEAGPHQDNAPTSSATPKVHISGRSLGAHLGNPLSRLTSIGSRWLPSPRPRAQANVHCLKHPSAARANPSCPVCSALAQHEARLHYRLTLNSALAYFD
jgi:hypothetical protein